VAGKVSDWLLANYGPGAKALVGSYRRRLDDGTNDAKHIMEDLRRFCSIYDTPAVSDKSGRTDEFATMRMIGRMEVFQHIAHVLGVTEDDLKPEKETTDDRDSRRGPGNADAEQPAAPRYAPSESDFADPAG
jgi:hypothetical protein